MKLLGFIFFILIFNSCTKEQFQANKSEQSTSISSAVVTSTQTCAQSTLIRPKVDILMLWDNTSSFNFVTPETVNSMSSLITNISDKFDYHVLSAPLVPNNQNDFVLIANFPQTITGNATSWIKSKDDALTSLNFTRANGGSEAGLDRAYDLLSNNRTNGIFRDGAYTLVVLMSNEDDKGCELSLGVNQCTSTDKNNYLDQKVKKLLCLRGATSQYTCTGLPTLNSTMMRFITVAPLTACASGLNFTNYIYKNTSKKIYEASYTNGWPTAVDDINPDLPGFPDSRNLCTINFSHLFDNVNTAIKEMLIKHVYNYWPVAGTNDSVDPDTIMVKRDDGKILINNGTATNPANGYKFIGNVTNHATRTLPTAGEYFTGKMIQLFGTSGNDFIIYPQCLTVTYQEMKANYGYIYLKNGEPLVSSIEVTINGVVIPENATNGWSYMGMQQISQLDPQFKIAELPPGTTSGFIIKLNGTAQVQNTSSINMSVFYTSKSTN